MNMELFGKPNVTPIDSATPIASIMAPPPIVWGAATAAERGPVVATLRDPRHRNAVGMHSGGYSVYRALAIAAKTLKPDQLADLTDTSPAAHIGPYPQWADAKKIVSLDPWGHLIGEEFRDYLARGYDIRPSIAVTRANIDMPEIREAIAAGRIPADGRIVREGGIRVVKAAIDPVWYLPGIAERFGIGEDALRQGLHEQTGGMYPELVNRPDLKVFLPPIGGTTIYCFGDPQKLADPNTPLACRVHDECNGSDVFGSDICTCRPYLAHGIEIAIQMAQQGGVGLVVYNRKEGRALGEVTKFLVYNARKRQKGGDRPEEYFNRTSCVAGVEDMRFQELMPDVLHWLGITRIHRFASMSDMKCNALLAQGITIDERVPIPDSLIPKDARVEIEAKIAAGYFAGDKPREAPASTVGRALDE
ncbi:MAG: GTP cyclohydrolase II [Xanthobacteraceae bacterium]